MRRHAVLRRCVVERKHRIRRSPRLKRADFLKIFALEKQRRAAAFIQSLAGQDRRPMNVRLNPITRRADFIEIDHGGLQIFSPVQVAPVKL